MVAEPVGNPPLRRADDIIQRVIEEADAAARARVEAIDRILSERIMALAERHEALSAVKEGQHAEMDLRYQQRFDAQQQLIRTYLNERSTQYQQRFEAQERAVEIALAGVDKEFHEHIKSAREEMAAALASTERAIAKSDAATERRFESVDKAVSKSEEALERRFESVNEFRAQLADQARTFMPRSESEQRLMALAEKVDVLTRAFSEAMAQVNSRLDLAAGRTTGIGAGWAYLIGAVGLLGAVIAIMTAVYGGG